MHAQNIDLCIRVWPANGDSSLVSLARACIGSGIDASFGGTVKIVQIRLYPCKETLLKFRRQNLTTTEDASKDSCRTRNPPPLKALVARKEQVAGW